MIQDTRGQQLGARRQPLSAASLSRTWALAVGLLAMAACAGTANNVCSRDPISGTQRCDDLSGGYSEAVATGAVAAGLWAVEGCKVNGCEPPFRCNAEKQCERLRCGETSECPSGYFCSGRDNRCH